MYSNLKEKILNIKKEKDAIILAHYYQTPEVQDIADAVGDSFYLSKLAKENKNSTIVLCGVKFMAESAKILSPEKTVLLPVLNAGCPMADMVDADKLIDFKNKHKNAKVVTYINSSTEIKALSDVCCTSSNALKIIENIDSDEIIFLPDKNLGEYIKEKVSNKNIILWQGFCPVHRQ
ncbi:quinolinate synthase NadA, partial [Clostridium acetireducens]|uniref:quinolinate synthase NadA n=1 Tax=Clostridium acetireducens TaxID=76489 RepID=UPI000AA59B40